MEVDVETTEDGILGGKLRLRQLVRGHRVGHDAILLAAATGARSGEHAIDLGAGVGAAGLALAIRIPGLNVTLAEIDGELCALAATNARLNGLHKNVRALAVDVENLNALKSAGLCNDSVDRVLMNPPFRDARRQNVSPDPRRRLAHVGAPGLLMRWISTAAWLLKPHGVLTIIWRADGLEDLVDAAKPAFGDIAVLPVVPRTDAPAIRVLVRAVKGGSGPGLVYPALALNDVDGRPTQAAETILRGGEPLNIARP